VEYNNFAIFDDVAVQDGHCYNGQLIENPTSNGVVISYLE